MARSRSPVPAQPEPESQEGLYPRSHAELPQTGPPGFRGGGLAQPSPQETKDRSLQQPRDILFKASPERFGQTLPSVLSLHSLIDPPHVFPLCGKQGTNFGIVRERLLLFLTYHLHAFPHQRAVAGHRSSLLSVRCESCV